MIDKQMIEEIDRKFKNKEISKVVREISELKKREEIIDDALVNVQNKMDYMKEFVVFDIDFLMRQEDLFQTKTKLYLMKSNIIGEIARKKKEIIEYGLPKEELTEISRMLNQEDYTTGFSRVKGIEIKNK